MKTCLIVQLRLLFFSILFKRCSLLNCIISYLTHWRYYNVHSNPDLRQKYIWSYNFKRGKKEERKFWKRKRTKIIIKDINSPPNSKACDEISKHNIDIEMRRSILYLIVSFQYRYINRCYRLTLVRKNFQVECSGGRLVERISRTRQVGSYLPCLVCWRSALRELYSQMVGPVCVSILWMGEPLQMCYNFIKTQIKHIIYKTYVEIAPSMR